MIDNKAMYPKPLPEDDGIISVVMERVPRWKESELSGDEWRYSLVTVVTVKDWENGGSQEISVFGKDFAQMALNLAAKLDDVLSYGNQKGVPYSVKSAHELRVCFQPGCVEVPENVYGIKQAYTWFPQQGRKMDDNYGGPFVRAFCGKHSYRGDCDLEDADGNYELLFSRFVSAVS